MESGSRNANFIFSAKIESVNNFALLLKAITFSENVNLYICDSGLKFTVEEGKYVQASVFMQKAMFQEFIMKEETAAFQITLKRLLECLKVFCNDGKGSESFADISSGATLNLYYQSIGSPFQMTLEEHGVRTDFNLKTEEVEDLMEFDMESSVLCRVIFKAEPMKDLLTEIDSNSPETVELIVDVNGPVILKNVGTAGSMEVSIDKNCEAVDSFDCYNRVAAHYKMSVLKNVFKALHLGQKLVLKVNDEAILCLAFIMSTKTDSFVEFHMMPQVQDDYLPSQSLFAA